MNVPKLPGRWHFVRLTRDAGLWEAEALAQGAYFPAGTNKSEYWALAAHSFGATPDEALAGLPESIAALTKDLPR